MTTSIANSKESVTNSLLPSRRAITICLDVLLLVAFVLLLSPRMTGRPLYEVMGIAFCVPLLVHLLIAWPWISQTTKRFFSRTDRRTSVNYILNVTLFLLMVLEIVSGVVISQVALPFIGVNTVDDRSWRALHNLTLNWTLLMVGLHVAMNWEWIVAAFHRQISAHDTVSKGRMQLAPTFGRAMRRIGLVILAAVIIAATTFAILGPPSEIRLYSQDEIARFAPTFGHGIGQFAAEAFLISLVACVGRQWLRVRL